MSKIADLAKAINKQWKSEVLTAGNLIPECKRFSMGTMSADYSLYGGLPEGKLVVYAGESGSCKSVLACLAIARYQQAHSDKVCIYVDAEETLRGQIDFMVKMTGMLIDDAHFLRYDCTGKSAEEIFSDIIKLQEADDIGLIVIDSAPMLLSQSDIDNDITKDNGQRASIAKPMGKFLKFMIPAIGKANNTLLIINHTRIAGKTFTGANIYTEPCGYALNFYPSVKVRFATRKFTKGDKYDISASQTDSETDGFCATFSVTKNRLGPLNRNGAKIIFRYDTGIDTLTDLIEIITKYEIAKKLSSVTWQLVNPITGEPYKDAETGEELKFAGKQKMIDYIRDHNDFRVMYEKVVSDFINKTNTDISLIDDEDLKQIKDMESSVESHMTETDDSDDEKLTNQEKLDLKKTSSSYDENMVASWGNDSDSESSDPFDQ